MESIEDEFKHMKGLFKKYTELDVVPELEPLETPWLRFKPKASYVSREIQLDLGNPL